MNFDRGDLVRVIHPWSTHADGGDGGFWGMKDGKEFFIKSGSLGTVIVAEGFRVLVTFGDRTCWLDDLSLERIDEAG
jgi:hypothetical protein